MLTLVAFAYIPQSANGATDAEKPKEAAAAGGKNSGPIAATEASTPLTIALKDGSEVRITCGIKLVGTMAASSGLYHYRLWVPAGYSTDPKRTWKTIFIASPGGNAQLGAMGDWVKSHGYIAVMLEESRNGPYGPIIANFLAAHGDVIKRMRVAEGKKVATGFSGGALASSHFVTIVPGFGGLILQGAGCSAIKPGGTYDVKEIK